MSPTVKALLPAVLLAGLMPTLAPAQMPGSEGDAVSAQIDANGFVKRLMQSNAAVNLRRIARDEVRTGTQRELGAFEPTASVSLIREDTNTRNTLEERLVRSGAADYERAATDFEVGVSQLLRSGAQIELKASLSSFDTSVEEMRQNRSRIALSVLQPLARDSGESVTMARVQVAEIDSDVAEYAVREAENNILAEGLISYYNWLLAVAREASERDKLETGERLLAEARARNQQGRMAAVEVVEVENMLDRYRTAVFEAEQLRRDALSTVRTMLHLGATTAMSELIPADTLPAVTQDTGSLEEWLERAQQLRADVRQRELSIERETVEVAYSRNQALPRVDLIASYGVGALEERASDAFDSNRLSPYPSWSVGVQIQVPLAGNQRARADIAAALLRQKDAALNAEALLIEIENDVTNRFALRQSAVQRWRHWQEIVAREDRQLALEQQRFSAGRSDVRDILLREERLINARQNLLEQQAVVARADVLLRASAGELTLVVAP
jgi:outer membrane protein TolC